MYVSPESAQGGEWLQGHGESQEPCGARQGDGPEGSLPPLGPWTKVSYGPEARGGARYH